MPFKFFLILLSTLSLASHAAWWEKCDPRVKREERRKAAAAIYVETCKAEMKRLKCDDYFADNEIPDDYKNDCSKSYLDYITDASNEKWKESCTSGAWEGFWNGDVITNGLDAVVDEFNHDEKPTPSLKLKHENREKWRKAMREQTDFISLPTEEKIKMFEASEEAIRKRMAASHKIDDVLKSYGIIRYCYAPHKQLELSCYGLGAMATTATTFGFGKFIVNGGVSRMLESGKDGFFNLLYKTAGIGKSPAERAAAKMSASVTEKLGYTPVIRDTSRAEEGFVKITAHKESGEEIAMFTGQLKDKGTFLDGVLIDVKEGSKRSGVSELAFTEAVARNKGIKKIGSTLQDSPVKGEGGNLTEFRKAAATGLDCFAALKKTPAYKIKARHGFGKIAAETTCEGAEPYLVLERGN